MFYLNYGEGRGLGWTLLLKMFILPVEKIPSMTQASNFIKMKEKSV